MRILTTILLLIMLAPTANAIRYEAFDPETGRLIENKTIDDKYIQGFSLSREDKLRASNKRKRSASAHKLLDNGPSENNLDIVVIGDGYTAAELGKYNSDVQALMNTFFADTEGLNEFFYSYRNSINFWRIDAVSNESGATHLETSPQIKKDTALGSYYGCAGIDRLICFKSRLLRKALKQSSLKKNARDIVLILVNDETHGGSGGKYAVSSTTNNFSEIVLHEIGHSFGRLADEYEDPSLCKRPTREPAPANATIASSRNNIKWKLWIDDFTDIPTTATSDKNLVGLFDGGNYCAPGSGFYRPNSSSKMLVLGEAFRSVNNEQLIKRFYESFADPIESFNPKKRKNKVEAGETLSFNVKPIETPEGNNITIEWFVDDLLITDKQNQETFIYDPSVYAAGSSAGKQKVRVIVKDNSNQVRKVSIKNLMQETKTWVVKYKN